MAIQKFPSSFTEDNFIALLGQEALENKIVCALTDSTYTIPSNI